MYYLISLWLKIFLFGERNNNKTLKTKDRKLIKVATSLKCHKIYKIL